MDDKEFENKVYKYTFLGVLLIIFGWIISKLDKKSENKED